MKVLILPSWYPSICQTHGTYFQEQAQFLNQNGFDIKILMAEELYTKNFWYQKFKRIFQLKRFKLSKELLLQEPQAYSFPVIIQKSWPDEKKLRVMDKAYLKAFEKLTRQLHWFPDIIHLQGMYKYGLSSYLISKKHNVPLVVIEHSPFRISNYKKAYQERIQRIFKIAKKIAGVSHFHKNCMVAVGVERPLEVVWNLMDEKKFFFQQPLKSKDSFIITTVLRASFVKDPVTFFDAILKFIESCSRGKHVVVNVVGISSLQDLTTMKSIDNDMVMKYKQLQPYVRFFSWLKKEDITKLHQESSVFVSTSTDEPYGLAIREAMLCGTSVISTQSGGPEDSIVQKTGILVAVGDAEGLAKALKSLYDNKQLFDYAYIRNYVIEQSGRDAFLKRMQDFYTIPND